jgi:DNA-binding GntR family transcriptional regulator
MIDVSSTPTREALLVLEHEGLIDPIPRTGYLVTPISIRDLQEIFHLRSVLEVEAIRLAVENITEEDINYLEENNRKESEIFEKTNQNNGEEYIHAYKLNFEFHLRIAAASGNKRLAKLIEELLSEMERILARDPFIAYPKQHVAIIKALKDRDVKASREAMIEHIENTKSRLLDRF